MRGIYFLLFVVVFIPLVIPNQLYTCQDYSRTCQFMVARGFCNDLSSEGYNFIQTRTDCKASCHLCMDHCPAKTPTVTKPRLTKPVLTQGTCYECLTERRRYTNTCDENLTGRIGYCSDPGFTCYAELGYSRTQSDYILSFCGPTSLLHPDLISNGCMVSTYHGMPRVRCACNSKTNTNQICNIKLICPHLIKYPFDKPYNFSICANYM